jgi:aspartyl protease family protein
LDGEQIGYTIFYGMFAVAIGLGLLYRYRGRLGVAFRDIAIWGLIFVFAILAFSLKDQFIAALYPSRGYSEGSEFVYKRAPDGHFYMTVAVNGVDLEFFVDTGATSIVLNKQDADRVGIDVENLRFLAQARTANGVVPTSIIRLDSMKLGKFEDFNVRASVNGGDLGMSLLGMSYLEKFNRMEIQGDTLRLIR